MRSVFLAFVLSAVPMASSAGNLYICAAHLDADDWASEWKDGPIIVPSGAIFAFGGELNSAPLQNPPETPPDPTDPRNNQAAVTLSAVTLAEKRPCVPVPAGAAINASWRWLISPIFGNNSEYYYIYAVSHAGAVSSSFEGVSAFDRVAQLNELYAQVQGSLTESVQIQDGD